MWKNFFKGLFSASPRAIVYLRSISRELKRSNDIAEAMLKTEQPQMYRVYKAGKVGSRVKLAGISTPTVESWNKRYKELHPVPDEDEGA